MKPGVSVDFCFCLSAYTEAKEEEEEVLFCVLSAQCTIGEEGDGALLSPQSLPPSPDTLPACSVY